jgi:hypothetical protein
MNGIKDAIKTVVGLLRLGEKWTEVLEKAFDPKAVVKDSFRDWYKGSRGWFVRTLMLLLIFLSLINISSATARNLSHQLGIGYKLSVEHMHVLLYAVECIVAIIIAFNIVLFGNSPPRKNQHKTDNAVLNAAADASRRFLRFWPLLWSSWFLLYLILTLVTLGVLPDDSSFVNALLNACNNASGVIMFSMYFEMAERSQEDPQQGAEVLYIPTGMVLLGLLALELIFTKSLPGSASGISFVFSFASGIIIGVVTGLLITKLSTRIINLPLWATTCLVVYAVIQPIFPIIARSRGDFEKDLAAVMLMIAFYGKILLFAVIQWARDTNRLVYYMARARRIYEEENETRVREVFMLASDKLQHSPKLDVPAKAVRA